MLWSSDRRLEMTPRLPPEVLTEILSYAKNDGIEITNPNTYPTNFSLVCKSWHALTLSAPEIWSDIRINLDHGEDTLPEPHDHPIKYKIVDDNLGPHILSALQTCLERSGVLKPLTLYIRARDVSALGLKRKKDVLESILKTLLPYAHRWSEVSFEFPIDTFIFMFPPDHLYPRLRRLDLLDGVRNSLVSSSPRVGAFSNAPVLRELNLYRFPESLSQLSIPWAQITDFALSVPITFAFPTTTQVAELMPNLHSLTLFHANPFLVQPEYSLPVPTQPPLNLPALEKLKVYAPYSRRYFRPFLGQIYTPRLTNLELKPGRHRYPAQWILEFENLIARSRCTITRLKLKCTLGAVVLTLLKAVSSTIEILELEDIDFLEELLNGMTISRGAHSVLSSPNAKEQSCLGQQIKRMVISRPELSDLEEGPTMFVSMIRSRLPALRSDYPSTSHPDSTPPSKPTPYNRDTSLTSLRIVIQQPYQTPSRSESSAAQTTASLYQLLVKNFVKPEYEALGVKLEILKEDARA